MNEIFNLLNAIRPEVDFERSNAFISDGLLDSFDVVSLVSTLDKLHSISISGTDVIPENFENAESITLLLARYNIFL